MGSRRAWTPVWNRARNNAANPRMAIKKALAGRAYDGPVNEKKPLASLNLRDIFHIGARQSGNLADDPVFKPYTKAKDLTLFQRIVRLSHWIAKEFPQFAAIYERQIKRMDEAGLALMKSLEEAPALFGKKRLSQVDRDSLRELIHKLYGKKTLLEENSGVDKFIVVGQFTNGRDKLAINPAYRKMFARAISGYGATAKAQKAFELPLLWRRDHPTLICHADGAFSGNQRR